MKKTGVRDVLFAAALGLGASWDWALAPSADEAAPKAPARSRRPAASQLEPIESALSKPEAATPTTREPPAYSAVSGPPATVPQGPCSSSLWRALATIHRESELFAASTTPSLMQRT